ncbi:MAG: hypothetical protein EHM47_05260 [Ignavibacteriales bacterium]|nr:MAG: hypothetical protein EHM47_05260 [Ignavibacteriales bacterium]
MEEKKLSLTDSLIKFLPDIPNAKQITIEALLRHKSGLANYAENTEYDKLKYKVKTK